MAGSAMPGVRAGLPRGVLGQRIDVEVLVGVPAEKVTRDPRHNKVDETASPRTRASANATD
jgi:hypothetical protein